MKAGNFRANCDLLESPHQDEQPSHSAILRHLLGRLSVDTADIML
jgi:hypothetical protein